MLKACGFIMLPYSDFILLQQAAQIVGVTPIVSEQHAASVQSRFGFCMPLAELNSARNTSGVTLVVPLQHSTAAAAVYADRGLP